MLDLADGQRLGSDEGMGARLGLAPRFDLVLGALTKKRKAWGQWSLLAGEENESGSGIVQRPASGIGVLNFWLQT